MTYLFSCLPLLFLQFKVEMLTWDCGTFVNRLSDFDVKALNANILICAFWRLLETSKLSVPVEVSRVSDSISHFLVSSFFGVGCSHVIDFSKILHMYYYLQWFSWLEDLFVFFSISRFNHVFKEHRLYLVSKCKKSPFHFLDKFFTQQGSYSDFCFKCRR